MTLWLIVMVLAFFQLSSCRPLPCHTLSHIPGPPKSTSHISYPPFLLQKTRTKKIYIRYLSIVCVGFYQGSFVRGPFVWKVLSGVVFPLLSEYNYNINLNMTLNFRFPG